MTETAIRNYKKSLNKEDELIVVVGPEGYNTIFDTNPYIDHVIKASYDQLNLLNHKYYLPGLNEYKTKSGEKEYACRLDCGKAFSWSLQHPSVRILDEKAITFPPHMALGFCDQLKTSIDELKYNIYLTDQEIEEGREYLSSKYKKPVILVGAISRSCTSREGRPPNKMVSEKVWSRVIEDLSADFDLIFLGAKNEEPLDLNVEWLMGMPIRKVAALCRAAELVISIDGGISHLTGAADGNLLLINAAVITTMICPTTNGKLGLIDKSLFSSSREKGISSVSSKEIIAEARSLVEKPAGWKVYIPR